MAIYDKQLPRPFVFAKYFIKYKAPRTDISLAQQGVVASKFLQILEKFLDTVLHSNRHANVASIDVALIRDHYLVHETGLVKTPLFLKDYATAQMLALDADSVTKIREDGDDDEDDMSLSGSSNHSGDSSSDGGRSRSTHAKKTAAIDVLLDRVLQKSGWSRTSAPSASASSTSMFHESTMRAPRPSISGS